MWERRAPYLPRAMDEGAPEPLFTVVMPVRDHEAYVEAAIRSVIAQSWAGWELVAVDDGSIDGSRAAIERLAGKDGRIRILEGDGKGRRRPATGASPPPGEVDRLPRQRRHLVPRDPRGLRGVHRRPPGRPVHPRLPPPPESRWVDDEGARGPSGGPDGDRELFIKCHLSTLSVCHERSLVEGTGGFDESLPAARTTNSSCG